MNVKIKVTKMFDPNSIKIKPVIKDTASRWAERTVNNIKISISGTKLKVRTGRLRNSIKYKISQSDNKTKIEIGSWNVSYAKIHDDKKSTSITTKSKRWLTVPVNPSVKGRARQYSNTFVVLTKKGTLLLAQKTGKSKIKPLFILKKFVVIKGTGYITDNVNLMKPFLINELRMNLEGLSVNG